MSLERPALVIPAEAGFQNTRPSPSHAASGTRLRGYGQLAEDPFGGDDVAREAHLLGVEAKGQPQ